MSPVVLPGLDIILPCYNPAGGWAESIIQSMRGISAELPGYPISLIIVNDGSQRGWDAAALDRIKAGLPGIRVSVDENPVNKGKGNALRRGVALANSPLQIYTDVDFPYTEASLIAVFRQLESRTCDIAAGVRDESYYKDVPAQRKTLSKFVRWLLRTFLSLRITDTQCGLKGFNAKGREVFLKTRIDRFLFDMEFIFLASNQKGLRLQAVPVELKPSIIFSKMSWRILIQEGFNFLGIFFRFIGGRIIGRNG